MRTVAVLLFLAGIVWLQIFLSRRQSRWPGLVLPGLAVLYSLLMVLSVAAYAGGGFPWGPLLASLLLGNIPTLILIAIYAACREKRRRQKEMDRMTLEDL